MSLLPFLKLPALAPHAAIEDEGDLHGVHPRRPEGLCLTLALVHLEIAVRRSGLIPNFFRSAASKQQDKKNTHTASLVRLNRKVYPFAHPFSSSLGERSAPAGPCQSGAFSF